MGLESDLGLTLQRYQVVGLDTMILIYHFEDHPLFAPLTQLLFDALAQGDLVAQVSVLLAGELLAGPKKAGDEKMLLHYRHVLSSYPNLRLQPTTMAVVEHASDLRARYRLRMPDAIHVATAQVHGAQAFMTNDSQLRQVDVEGLEILILSDFLESHQRTS
jgi:predicted nucleic acid-binding protein